MTPPALLVVGRGPGDEAGAEALRSLVRVLGDRSPGLPVGGGFTEGSRLPLTAAVADLVARQQVRELAAVPLVLGRDGHAERETAEALEREEKRYAGVSCTVRRGPLGPHPALLGVLERRLDEALGGANRTPSDRTATTVLLVGRGSTDPEANAELYRLARLLWEGGGYASVETAFVSRAAPDVPSGLDRCARLTAGADGGRGRVVVLPYLLFDGELPNRLRQQAEGWSDAAQVEVRLAQVLWPAEELADLVLERYRGLLPPEAGDGLAGAGTR